MTPTEATHADQVVGKASVEQLRRIYAVLVLRAISLGMKPQLPPLPYTPLALRRAIRGLTEQIAARSHTATCACHLCLGTVVATRYEQEEQA